MRTYRLQITTPMGVLFEGDAVQLSVRAVDGDRAILAGHIPLATALKDGECRVYFEDGTIRRARCGGGLLSVKRDKVRLLSTNFKWEEE